MIKFVLSSGRGAWQSWNYELSIENERDGKRRTVRGINSTGLRVSKLEPDTPYFLRVAAYTEAGRGPWSSPFHAKSLTTSKPKILWSTAEGLVMSEPTGETARTLIHPRSLKVRSYSHSLYWPVHSGKPQHFYVVLKGLNLIICF